MITWLRVHAPLPSSDPQARKGVARGVDALGSATTVVRFRITRAERARMMQSMAVLEMENVSEYVRWCVMQFSHAVLQEKQKGD